MEKKSSNFSKTSKRQKLSDPLGFLGILIFTAAVVVALPELATAVVLGLLASLVWITSRRTKEIGEGVDELDEMATSVQDRGRELMRDLEDLGISARDLSPLFEVMRDHSNALKEGVSWLSQVDWNEVGDRWDDIRALLAKVDLEAILGHVTKDDEAVDPYDDDNGGGRIPIQGAEALPISALPGLVDELGYKPVRAGRPPKKKKKKGLPQPIRLEDGSVRFVRR